MVKRYIFALAACGGAKFTPPPQALTTREWVKRCTHHIEVANIELDEFAPTNTQPPQRFDQTAIAKIGRGQE